MPMNERRLQNEDKESEKATLQTRTKHTRGKPRARRRDIARLTRLRASEVGIPAPERNDRQRDTRSSQRGNRRRSNTSRRYRLAAGHLPTYVGVPHRLRNNASSKSSYTRNVILPDAL